MLVDVILVSGKHISGARIAVLACEHVELDEKYEVIHMRPYRTLLSLLSSLVLCMFVWIPDVHALSVTVQVRTPDVANTLQFSQVINFTSIAAGTPGCLSGFACNSVTGWSGGAAGTITYGSGATAIRISTSPGFTSGPIASLNTSAVAFGLNGMIFQGFSTGTGRLSITLENNFSTYPGAITANFGFMESGSFLQPGGNVGVVGTSLADTLTMQGTLVNSTGPPTPVLFPLSPILKTAGTGVSFPYNFNLSPTLSYTSVAGGTTLKYTWVYNYTNSGTATSKFSDNGEGEDASVNCVTNPTNQKCSVQGGVAEYLVTPGPVGDAFVAALAAQVLPEPSSDLLLGLGLLSGGIFFASRLRKEKERETR